jgi:NADH:ubiquinone oxidoreductase subunit H
LLVTATLPLVSSSGLLSTHAHDSDILLALLLLEASAILSLIPLAMLSGSYTHLGTLRHLKALILSDILLDTGIAILLLTHNSLATSILHTPTLTLSGLLLLFIPLAITLLILTGKEPFDLPEAESELVAGILTELSGVTFSFFLLTDMAEFIVYLLIGINTISIRLVGIVFFILVYNISYLGRTILTRISLIEVPKLVFGSII